MGRGKTKSTKAKPSPAVRSVSSGGTAKVKLGRGKGQKKVDEMMQFPVRRSARNRASQDEKNKKEDSPNSEGIELLLEFDNKPQVVTVAPKVTSKKSSKRTRKSSIQEEKITTVPPVSTEDVSPSTSKKTKVDVSAKNLKLSEDEQRELLKNFDIDPVYGPSRGISRRQRYERALRFKIQPVPDTIIQEILDAHENDVAFQKCLWDQNEPFKLHKM